MPNLTGSRRQKLEWIEARLDAWGTDPGAVGLSAAQVALLRGHAEATREAMVGSGTLHAQALSATREFHTRAAAMTTVARDVIATVKAFARTQGGGAGAGAGGEVLVRSNITPAAAPTPSPAPDAPTNINVSISATGAVTLAWDASLEPRGVFFLVERARGAAGGTGGGGGGGGGGFTLIGGTGERTLADPAPQLADGPVFYRVRAVRGEKMSAWTTPVVVDVGGAGKGTLTMAA